LSTESASIGGSMRLSPGNTLVEDGGRNGVHYGGDQELSSRSYDSRRWRQKKGCGWLVREC
jgi:hypothetical protein